MNGRAVTIGIVAAAALASLVPSAAVAQRDQRAPRRADQISESDIAYRYRLFETSNIWTFILLDTATGRASQVQYSLNDTPSGMADVNESSLLPEGADRKNGRFTLYPTQNTYNFLLLDREDGRVWQMQWSHEPKRRGIVRLIE